jgi:hypothetical protein
MKKHTRLEGIIKKESKLNWVADFWLNVLEGLGGIPRIHDYSYSGDRLAHAAGSHPADYGSMSGINGFSVRYSLKHDSFMTLQIFYQTQEILTFSFYTNNGQYRTMYDRFEISKYENGVLENELTKMLPKKEKIIVGLIEKRQQREHDAERR